MNWIVAKIKWIMLVAGGLTCSMLYAVVMPSEAVDFLFDRSLESSLGEVIVPTWAAMVVIVGAMLIYGAYVPQARTLALYVASASKLTFLGMMLARGRQFLDDRVSLVIALDVVMVSLFLAFMLGVRLAGRRRQPVSQPATVSQPAMSPVPRADQRVQAPPRPPVVKAR